MSEKAHKAIQKLCSGGGVAHMDEGGTVPAALAADDSTPAPAPNPGNFDITQPQNQVIEPTPADTTPQAPSLADDLFGTTLTGAASKAVDYANKIYDMTSPENIQAAKDAQNAIKTPQSAAEKADIRNPASAASALADEANEKQADVNQKVAQENPFQKTEMDKALQNEKNAHTAEAKAIGSQGNAEKNAMQAIQEKIDAMPTQAEILNKYDADQKRLYDAYANKTIDPNRFLHNMGTGSKILAGIGMLLSGFGAGAGKTSSAAQQVISNAINQDIEAQKNDQQQAHTLWSMNREALGSDLAANLATQNQLYTGLKYQLQQAASQYKGPIAMAQAQAANALIDKEIAQNHYRLSFLQPNKNQVLDPNYPEKMVVNSGAFKLQ